VDVPVFKWGNAFISVNQSIGFKNILDDSVEAKTKYQFIYDQKLRNWSTGVNLGLSIPVNKK